MKTPQVTALQGMTPMGFKDTRPQFNRKRHGSLYDRGSADSWYSRNADPHWYPDGTGNGEKIKLEKGDKLYDLYMQGYNEEPDRKDYGYDPE